MSYDNIVGLVLAILLALFLFAALLFPREVLVSSLTSEGGRGGSCSSSP